MHKHPTPLIFSFFGYRVTAGGDAPIDVQRRRCKGRTQAIATIVATYVAFRAGG